MTRRPLGIVAGIALAVILLGLGTAASLAQTGKPAAKKTAEPATRVPAPTPMRPDHLGPRRWASPVTVSTVTTDVPARMA